MPHFTDFVYWFRQAMPYINQHKGKTFILHLDADIEDAVLTEILQDIALLKSLNIHLVIIFADPLTQGAYQPVNQQKLAELQTLMIQRYHQLCAGITTYHGNTEENLSICQGNWIIAKPEGVIQGLDYLHKGVIRHIKTKVITSLLQQGHVLFFNSICYSQTGKIYHVNSLDIAASLANQLKANKLIFLSNLVIRNNEAEMIREINEPRLEYWLQQHPQQPEITRLLHTAYQTYAQTERIHIINSQQKHSLLMELFSRDGIGTLISRTNFETINTADINDINRIIELIHPLEQRGVMRQRSREKLEHEIGYFLVMKRDNYVIGCVAIYPIIEQHTAELACLVIDPEYHCQGRGSRLLAKAENMAIKQGINTLYLLTTHTYEWFSERGFYPTDPEQLPAGTYYNQTRKSKVLHKQLQAQAGQHTQ